MGEWISEWVSDLAAERVSEYVSSVDGWLTSTFLSGFSGAEVVACVQEAAMLAVDAGAESLAEAHMVASIAATKPQITESVLAFYADIAAKYH